MLQPFRHWKKMHSVPRTFVLPSPMLPILDEWAKSQSLGQKELVQEIVVKAILNHCLREANCQSKVISPTS